MTVRFLKRARQELGAQLAWLASVSPDASARLLEDVDRALVLLDGVSVDSEEIELASGRRVRRWLVPPLALYYARRGAVLVIVRVRHGAQRPIVRA